MIIIELINLPEWLGEKLRGEKPNKEIKEIDKKINELEEKIRDLQENIKK